MYKQLSCMLQKQQVIFYVCIDQSFLVKCLFSQMQSSLLPLIDAHEQLVTELKRILYQLAPPPR